MSISEEGGSAQNKARWESGATRPILFLCASGTWRLEIGRAGGGARSPRGPSLSPEGPGGAAPGPSSCLGLALAMPKAPPPRPTPQALLFPHFPQGIIPGLVRVGVLPGPCSSGEGPS